MYKISVVVPIYNKENYIEKCLDTLEAQTWITKGLGELEVVLVDDGSTDASGVICDKYAERVSGEVISAECISNEENSAEGAVGNGLQEADCGAYTIRVIHKENGGLVSAWKRGVQEATGDYVTFVDCDDWIDLDMFEVLGKYVTGRGDEIILSDYIIEREGGASTPVYQAVEPGEYLKADIQEKIIPVLWGLEDRAVCRSRCMKLFSTDLAKKNMRYGDERLRFGEDTSLTIPCVLDAGRLYFCDHKAMYHYRYVDDSMVHIYDRTMLGSIELVQYVTELAIKEKADSEGNLLGLSVDEMINLSRKEYIFLLMYAVKNEAKAPKDEYIANIQKICLNKDNKEMIQSLQVRVNHLSNKLIYRVMTNPSGFNCRLLRLAMQAWEHR